LPVVSASIFADKPVPERRWIVPDMIPDRTVTIASGDGAVGKSTLMLQLATAIVGGVPWIGKNPDPGPVVVVSAEDDIGSAGTAPAQLTPPLARKSRRLACDRQLGGDEPLHASSFFRALTQRRALNWPNIGGTDK
jgi:hypothetical protein